MCIRYLHRFICDCGAEIRRDDRTIHCPAAKSDGRCFIPRIGEVMHHGPKACQKCKSWSDYVSPPPETVMENGGGAGGRGVDQEMVQEDKGERGRKLETKVEDMKKRTQQLKKLKMEKVVSRVRVERRRSRSPPAPRASAIKIKTTNKWSGPSIFEFAFEMALKEQVEQFEKRSSVRKRKSSPNVVDEDDGPEWLEVEGPAKLSPRRVSKKAKRDVRVNSGRPSFYQYGF